MPGSAGSSWYFLRYMDARNDSEAWSKPAENYWQQVDLYLGGSEHAVGHLLYSRFWHKVFFDMGLVSQPEPYKRLVHQGYILGENHEKMSKSRGNVINPDDVVARYGADTFRVYEMFMGPIEKAKPWSTGGIEGVYRFLSKYYRAVLEEDGSLKKTLTAIPEAQWPKEFRHVFHKTIKQVGSDIEGLSFNTAISALMILLNEAHTTFSDSQFPREFVRIFNQLLSPFAPHIAEEVWQLLGHSKSISFEAWPIFNPELCVSDVLTLGIQVNGKLRDSIEVPLNISQDEIQKLVMGREAVVKWMEGKPLKKFVYVKGRIVSVVV
jgi:leucyl-tRNA synthetase